MNKRFFAAWWTALVARDPSLATDLAELREIVSQLRALWRDFFNKMRQEWRYEMRNR